MSRRGLVLFVAMCVIWGVPYLLIRVAVRELTPGTLVFGRTALAALLLLPPAVARGELRRLLSRWLPLLAFATVEIGVPWLLLSSAEKRLSSSLTGLLIAAVPLVGAVVTFAIGSRDRLGSRQLAGILLGLAGVAALVGFDLHTSSGWGLAEVAAVAVGYAIGPIVLSRYLSDLPAVSVMAVTLGACAIVYAPVAALELPRSLPRPGVLASVLVLAVVCTAVAFLLFFALIAEIGPVRATVITYVNPAVAAVLGVAVLGESFTLGMGVGFVLILAGSVLATRSSAGAEAPAPLEPAAAVPDAQGA